MRASRTRLYLFHTHSPDLCRLLRVRLIPFSRVMMQAHASCRRFRRSPRDRPRSRMWRRPFNLLHLPTPRRGTSDWLQANPRASPSKITAQARNLAVALPRPRNRWSGIRNQRRRSGRWREPTRKTHAGAASASLLARNELRNVAVARPRPRNRWSGLSHQPTPAGRRDISKIPRSIASASMHVINQLIN